jgi:DNA-directed RNA polymerase subunit RPC12/RpoP
VHSFKCLACRLEFQLFSWLDDRHTASNVACPECGRIGGPKLHWIATLNESPEFGFGGAREIFQFNPRPGSILVE